MSAMKINLIGMILNKTGRAYFNGALTDNDGKELPAEESLHTLIMEYAKVVNGGKSDLLTAPERFMPKAQKSIDETEK